MSAPKITTSGTIRPSLGSNTGSSVTRLSTKAAIQAAGMSRKNRPTITVPVLCNRVNGRPPLISIPSKKPIKLESTQQDRNERSIRTLSLLSDSELVRRFQRHAAASANDGRAVTTRERISHLDRTLRAIERFLAIARLLRFVWHDRRVAQQRQNRRQSG